MRLGRSSEQLWLDVRALLAKSLPNRPHHKGCVWAHESRADLEPLRFSTHERSGVGSESGYAGEQFSRFFSLVSLTRNFGQGLKFSAVSYSLSLVFHWDWMAGHWCWGSLNRNPKPLVLIPCFPFLVARDWET